MSAFMTNPQHIATCAAILREHVDEVDGYIWDNEEVPGIPDREVRLELMSQNEASVRWRYGPEGRAQYAPMLTEIVGDEQHEDDEKDISHMFRFKTSDYLTAKPIKYRAAEAYRYLGCLEYHSCEHEEWKNSKARRWIREAKISLGGDMANMILSGRCVSHVGHEIEGCPVVPAETNDVLGVALREYLHQWAGVEPDDEAIQDVRYLLFEGAEHTVEQLRERKGL